jgi:hypothetical protein
MCGNVAMINNEATHNKTLCINQNFLLIYFQKYPFDLLEYFR